MESTLIEGGGLDGLLNDHILYTHHEGAEVCFSLAEHDAALIHQVIPELRTDLQVAETDRDSYKNQAEYERQARIDAANFPRNRHGYIPCQRCGIDCGMDAILPDDVWALICPEPDWPEAGMLCLWCMDELLVHKGWYAPVEARLYFAGKVLHSAMPATRLDSALDEAHAWARATFPTETTEGVVKHLQKEVGELAKEPGDPGEIADVLILLARLADRHGIDLAEAVRDKLAILRTREWGEPDADGVVEHVRGDAS